MNISFHGAAGMVTGSCFLIESSQGKILIDCGLVQGSKKMEERNYYEFPFNPQEIDVLLLTHAHIDHSGLIPKLCKKGFKGKIFATTVTKELCEILLPDSAYIQEMEVERKNRKNKRANRPLLEPIYTMQDAEDCIRQFVGISYDTKVEVLPGVDAVFRDAGHIIGSAMIELDLEGQKIIFSGDIGKENQPIIKDPTFIEKADYIIMESTYGNRFHLQTEDKSVQFARIINRTLRKGGNVIVPAFAIERTQEIIYLLKKLIKSGDIPAIDVYIDSPLAIKATEIFIKYPNYYDEEAKKMSNGDGNLLEFPSLKFSLSPEESMKLNTIKNNTVIISASGMCEAGRIKHHLKHNLWREECSVVFVGFQAHGTLGRRILDGEKKVRIHGEEIAVNANIERIEGFSAHADQKGLVEWVKNFSSKPKKIFLVHGEPESSANLAQILIEETKNEVVIPKLDETFDLEKEDIDAKPLDIESLEREKEILRVLYTFEDKLKELLPIDKKDLIINEIEKLRDKLI